MQPWQLLAGALSVVIPGLLLAILGTTLHASTPGVLFLTGVALATYLAGWAGGATALLVAAVWLDLFFIGDRRMFNMPVNIGEGIAYAITILCGVGMILLIERVKHEGAIDRREAMAARAATAALATLEASSLPEGETVTEERAMQVLLDAMLRANRTHGGVVLLMDEVRGIFTVAAQYGAQGGEELATTYPVDAGFAARIAMDRRPAMLERVSRSAAASDPMLQALGFESVLGIPLVSDDDGLLGVAVTGLVLPHRFTATEAARAEAIAARATALLRAARAGDAREMQLSRAQEARDRLYEVLQTMPEAVVLTAPPDGRVVSFNAAAVRLLGSLETWGPLSDLTGRLLTPEGVMLDPADLPHLRALRTGEVVDSVELMVRLGDGRQTPILASAAPLRELDRSISAVVVVFRDIHALKDAARLKVEFVSVVSHELRSPMTPIRGFVQLVARDLEREGQHEQQVRWLRTISSHVDRMTRLVDDLLDVSRLKSGTLDIRPEPTDLVEVTEDVVSSRQASAPGRHVALAYRGGPLVGEWDQDRLHQIIDNLVGNAIKYSPEGSQVTVELANDSRRGQVSIVVRDQGPGIPAEDRERIFSAFFRTREATEGQIAGLGLGLYIVSELVAAHGGTISVGENPGGGSAFRVTLPLKGMSAAA
jgi:signal transduction histidine kinase